MKAIKCIFPSFQISALMNKKVWLNCGGSIIIEETEALTAIDVNTGRYIGSRNLEETVLVDLCPQGEGIWFDVGELGALITRLARRKPEAPHHVINFLGEVFKPWGDEE